MVWDRTGQVGMAQNTMVRRSKVFCKASRPTVWHTMVCHSILQCSAHYTVQCWVVLISAEKCIVVEYSKCRYSCVQCMVHHAVQCTVHSSVQCMVQSAVRCTSQALCPRSYLIGGQIWAAIVWIYTGVVRELRLGLLFILKASQEVGINIAWMSRFWQDGLPGLTRPTKVTW